MPGRKTHNAIADAFKAGKPLIKRARNASTNRLGVMYEVKIDGDRVSACYWGTPVVTLDRARNEITLRDGGYQTVTTKALMNAILWLYNAQVWQTKGIWKIHRVGLWEVDFEDGMILKISPNYKDLIPVKAS